MQKFGSLNLHESNQTYQIVWSDDGTSFTRFDVIENLEKYNTIDTSTCDAAYLATKGKIKYNGDQKLVEIILRTIADASTFSANMKQEMNIVDGRIKITQEKEAPKLGLRWYVVMDSGYTVEEFYETKEATIIFDSINSKMVSKAIPINDGLYEDYGQLTDRHIVDKSTGDYYSVEYLKAKYPLDHMKNYDTKVVLSMEEAEERLELWKNAPTKVKAIDLETTGLGWSMLGDDVLVGVVLSWNENEGTYFPFRQLNFPYNLPISYLTKIVETVNNQPKDVKIIGHNVKVEKQGIWKESKYYVGNSHYAREWDEKWEEHAPEFLDLRADGDSMLLSILVNPVFKRDTHALKSLAARIRKVKFLELDEIFKNKKDIKFNVLPPELVELYACMDTANAICVWNNLLKELPVDELGILDLEDRLISMTAEMEFYGMRTLREYLLKAIENEQYIVDFLADTFKKFHKLSANINSNDVRRRIFYENLRAPIKVRTKTGAPSTSNIALNAIIEAGRIKAADSKEYKDIVDLNGKVVVKGKDMASNHYPSLVVLAAYAKHFKELGALKRIDRKSRQDRVQFGLNQCGAATGRATSDAHQYSDAMKMSIAADTEDYNLWSSDFKQVELRILPFVAGQQDLINIESDMDVDAHRAILSILTKKPVWAISAGERRNGKSTNFGVVYMMSAYGLAKKNKGPDYTTEDYVDAINSITGFYNGFPYIKMQVEKNKHDACTYGYLKTRFGRRRYFPELLDPTIDEKRKSSLIRAANNFPIQGFGADLLKICQCNVMDYIHKKGWDKLVESRGRYLPLVRVMLPIHDELLVSSHKSIPPEEIITMFKVCMEVKIAGAPPFYSAPAMVNSWYDGKLDAYELDLHFRDEIIEAWDKNKTRLLHYYTYNDAYDWKEAMSMQEHCKELRGKMLQLFSKDLQREGLAEEASVITGTEISDFKTPRALSDEEKKARPLIIKRLCKELIEEGRHKEAYMLVNGEMEELSKHYTKDGDRILTVQRLMDSSFEWYLEDLSAYRNNRLKKYMDDLIQQYKTPEAVAAHVTHPELTHTLIAIKIKKDEKFEHTEAILEATKRYMAESASRLPEDLTVDLDKEEDKNFIQSFDDIEEFIQLDENGQAILPDEDEEDEFSGKEDVIVEEQHVEHEYKRSYCTFMLNSVTIDISDFDNLPVSADAIRSAVKELHKNSSFYRVQFYTQGKLENTEYKIDYMPDDIDNIIYQRLKFNKEEEKKHAI